MKLLKTIKGFLTEAGLYKHSAIVIFPELNFDSDNDDYIDVYEQLDLNEGLIEYSRVPETRNMLEIKTNINLEEDIVKFLDEVLYPIQELGIKVNFVRQKY